jgi:hypothetical protein
MNAPALRPRTIGEILDTAFQLYRSRWSEMALATGVLVMPLLLLEAVAPWELIPLLERLGNLFFMAASAAVVAITAGAYRGDDVDAVDAVRAVGRRFFSVWGATIIQGLLVGIGLVFLVVPGILFLAMTFGMQQAVMIEGRSAGEAYTRSKVLAEDSFMFILLTSVMAFIITIAAMIGFGLVAAQAITSPRLALLATNAVMIALNPFAAVVGTVLYYDLRIRKEAFDVAVATERLEGAVPAPAV